MNFHALSRPLRQRSSVRVQSARIRVVAPKTIPSATMNAGVMGPDVRRETGVGFIGRTASSRLRLSHANLVFIAARLDALFCRSHDGSEPAAGSRQYFFEEPSEGINKRVNTTADAVAGVRDGSTVLVAGFGAVGVADNLLEALHQQGARELTIVANNSGNRSEEH